MTEMDQPENKNPQAEFRTYLEVREGWVSDSVELLTGDRTQNPAEVLPLPTEVRDEAESLPLSTEQEDALREIGGRFGIGGEQNVVIEADYQIMEGGKPWKVESEVRIAGSAKSLIFAGSPYRTIGEDESDYVAGKFDTDLSGKSEYDMVRLVAEKQDGFVPLETDEVMPFGYDISNSFTLVEDATGQLIQIGSIHGKPVVLIRVDRENYTDEEGKSKYRNQPDSAALMGIVADVLQATGDGESTVGMNTSNTYASRALDAVRAGLAKQRVFSVGMYGRKTIAEVQGKDIAEPTHINQIPGELRVMHDKLQQLRETLKLS